MKIVSACIATLIAVAVTGCAGRINPAALRVRQAMEEANRINLECRALKLQGKLTTWVEAVHCGNEPMRRMIQDSGYPHMDLVNLLLANRVLLAERMDAGQLTEAEATVQLAELLTRIAKEEQARATEEQARALAASRAYSERLMGIGMSMQGMGTLNQSLNPPPPPLVIVPSGR